eukprot:5507753-Amphidinium_carterae.1
MLQSARRGGTEQKPSKPQLSWLRLQVCANEWWAPLNNMLETEAKVTAILPRSIMAGKCSEPHSQQCSCPHPRPFLKILTLF